MIEITLVYAELIAYGSGRVDVPDKKVPVYIIYGFEILMSRIGKPLGCLIFFWVGEGLERRVGVLPIGLYKGGYGEIFRKVKMLGNFQNF